MEYLEFEKDIGIPADIMVLDRHSFRQNCDLAREAMSSVNDVIVALDRFLATVKHKKMPHDIGQVVPVRAPMSPEAMNDLDQPPRRVVYQDTIKSYNIDLTRYPAFQPVLAALLLIDPDEPAFDIAHGLVLLALAYIDENPMWDEEDGECGEPGCGCPCCPGECAEYGMYEGCPQCDDGKCAEGGPLVEGGSLEAQEGAQKIEVHIHLHQDGGPCTATAGEDAAGKHLAE